MIDHLLRWILLHRTTDHEAAATLAGKMLDLYLSDEPYWSQFDWNHIAREVE